MAQIREFESTTESYFILDGVSYPKVYEAMLDNGYSDTKIKLVGTNRDTKPLVFSTQYTNIRVDGDSFDTALEAISRLNQIVFSKGGGSGTGGATNVITEDSDTVTFTGNGTAGNPLSAESVGGGTTGVSYSTQETLTGGTWIDGKPIYRKVINGMITETEPYPEIDIVNLNIQTILPTTQDKVYGLNFDDNNNPYINWLDYKGDFKYGFNVRSSLQNFTGQPVPSLTIEISQIKFYSDIIKVISLSGYTGLDGNYDSSLINVENIGYSIILEYTKNTD